MSPYNAPSTASTAEELGQEADTFMVAYFYIIYKMQCREGISGKERIAPSLTYDSKRRAKARAVLARLSCGFTYTPPRRRAAPFNKFVRHVMQQDERPYKTSWWTSIRYKLNTTNPDIMWVGRNLWKKEVGYPGTDYQRLHYNDYMHQPPYSHWCTSLDFDICACLNALHNILWIESYPKEEGTDEYKRYIDLNAMAEANRALDEVKANLEKAVGLLRGGYSGG